RAGPAEPRRPLPGLRLRPPGPGGELAGGSRRCRQPPRRSHPDPRRRHGGAMMRTLLPTRTARRCTGLLILLLVASGCASSASRMPSVRVDEAIRDEFPVEGRRWAYEAENEVIIALDRRDEAAVALAAARKRVDEAERAREVANK